LTSTLTYPHTTINADLGTLIGALAESNPELSQLAAQVLQQYTAKKNFYVTRISELESGDANADGGANLPDFPFFSDDNSNGVPFGMTGLAIEKSQVRQLPDYPHTDILNNIATLQHMLLADAGTTQDRLELLQAIATDYTVKKAFLFATIEKLLAQ
jgi:hypothetical protein